MPSRRWPHYLGSVARHIINGVYSRRVQADAGLTRLIREVVERHHRRYGSPRVREELRREYGQRVSLKRVAWLMRQHGLNTRIRRLFVRTTRSDHRLPVCPNILNRDFHAQRCGEKWVSDITYPCAGSSWLYLTVVIDLFDRKVIGWSFSADMETRHTTIPALEMAVVNHPAQPGLIFHSDRGVQYCAASFRECLRELCPDVRQSMSRKGNCWDNACAESFFKTLKRELETLDGACSDAEIRQSVFLYIEAYYNQVRLHSALHYNAPNVFYLGQAA